MGEYEFTLRYLLPTGLPAEVLEQRLFEGGCGDALLGLGQKGRLTLAFTRPAPTAKAAVISALRDVVASLPEGRLVEVGPDWVSMKELAFLLKCSHEYLVSLIGDNAATFPLPLHAGKAGLWHLAEVLGWFAEHQDKAVDECLREVAIFNRTFNVAKDFRLLDTAQRQQMVRLAGVASAEE